MTEPLAATLPPASVLAMMWAAERRGGGPRARARPCFWGRRRWCDPSTWRSPRCSHLLLLRPPRAARAPPAPGAIGGPRSGVAFVLAPWTIRNLVVLDRFVPLSTGGGQVLFIGTHLPDRGRPAEGLEEELLERHPCRRESSPRLLAVPAAARGRPAERAAAGGGVILAALAAGRHPRLDSDVALARIGREQLSHDLTEEPWRSPVSSPTSSTFSAARPRNVMREPVWTLFHLLRSVRRDRPGGADRGEAPGGAADRRDPGGDHPDRAGSSSPRRGGSSSPSR